MGAKRDFALPKIQRASMLGRDKLAWENIFPRVRSETWSRMFKASKNKADFDFPTSGNRAQIAASAANIEEINEDLSIINPLTIF